MGTGSVWSKTFRACDAMALLALGVILLPVGAVPAKFACIGDCDDNCDISVDEVVTMVRLALEGGIEGCGAGDLDGDGTIDVSEILVSLNSALAGCSCPAPRCGDGLPEGDEHCDDGGVCVGESAGATCVGDWECAGDVGVCVGGTQDLRACPIFGFSSCEVGGGYCALCRPVGGDGCAANCTNETAVSFRIRPSPPDVGAPGGPDAVLVRGALFDVPMSAVTGSFVMTVGGPRRDGAVPMVIKVDDFDVAEIPVQTFACACVRTPVASTCGGFAFDETGAPATNCTAGFLGAETCPPDLPCAAVHGSGNAASGWLTCGGNESVIEVVHDCGAAGENPLPPEGSVRRSDRPVDAEEASALFSMSAAIGVAVGLCSGTAPDYGPDGTFCTEDDPTSSRGVLSLSQQTTGRACGRIENAQDGLVGSVPPGTGFECASGAPFACDPNGSIVGTSGASLAGVFTLCDEPTIGDAVVLTNLEAE